MFKESSRLDPIECHALKTIDQYLCMLKVHLITGSANKDNIHEALIEASALLGDIALWIAEDNGITFKSSIESRLIGIAQAMEQIAVEDIPELPDHLFENIADDLESVSRRNFT